MRFTYSKRKMDKLFAKSGDPAQTPRSAASELGLHCLPITLLRVSRLQWVKRILSSSAVIILLGERELVGLFFFGLWLVYCLSCFVYSSSWCHW